MENSNASPELISAIGRAPKWRANRKLSVLCQRIASPDARGNRRGGPAVNPAPGMRWSCR